MWVMSLSTDIYASLPDMVLDNCWYEHRGMSIEYRMSSQVGEAWSQHLLRPVLAGQFESATEIKIKRQFVGDFFLFSPKLQIRCIISPPALGVLEGESWNGVGIISD